MLTLMKMCGCNIRSPDRGADNDDDRADNDNNDNDNGCMYG